MLSREEKRARSPASAAERRWATRCGNIGPRLLSSEIAEPDGAPVRVRLLGEELVAFRDTEGHVGLVEDSARTAARRSSSGATRSAACAASITAGSST